MKDLLKLILRSEIVLGLIPYLALVISDFAIFGFQQSINADDREVFSCVPRWNVSTEQRCYDNFTLDLGVKFYVMFTLNGFFFPVRIITMIQNTRYLWKFKHNRMIQNEESQQSVNSPLNWSPDKFRRKRLLSLGVQLFCVGLSTIYFCFQYNFIESKYEFSSPLVYKCSLYSTDPTPVRFNQTFSCYDQHYEGKADFNIATVVIKLFVMVLYMINFIYVVKTEANKLLDKLLGDFVEAGGSINLQEMPSSTRSGGYARLRSPSNGSLYRDENVDGSERYPIDT